MLPDLLDPMFLRLLAACQRQLLRGATKARHPTRRWVSGPNSGPERCSGYVFGLKTFTAPVPGGTIGGVEPAESNGEALRESTPSRNWTFPFGQRDAQYKPEAPTPHKPAASAPYPPHPASRAPVRP